MAVATVKSITKTGVDFTSLIDHFFDADRIIMLEHEPICTLGTASDPSFVLIHILRLLWLWRRNRSNVSRSLYPVLDLRQYRTTDIHWYVRALEEDNLAALAERKRKHLDIRPVRDDGVTGIFVPGYGKIAAVGYQLLSLDYATRASNLCE